MPAHVALHIGCESIECGAEVVDRAVGMVAGSATHDLVRPSTDSGQVAAIGVARGQPLHGLGDGAKPEDTRPALAGALAGEVAHDPRRLADAAPVAAEHADHAASDRDVLRAE